MQKVTNINSDSRQKFNFALESGIELTVILNYVDNQAAWFFSIASPVNGFAVTNRRLTNSPNILRAFRRIIPFGFACTVSDGEEPIYQQDLVSGRVSLYFLSPEEVLEVEAFIKQEGALV